MLPEGTSCRPLAEARGGARSRRREPRRVKGSVPGVFTAALPAALRGRQAGLHLAVRAPGAQRVGLTSPSPNSWWGASGEGNLFPVSPYGSQVDLTTEPFNLFPWLKSFIYRPLLTAAFFSDFCPCCCHSLLSQKYIYADTHLSPRKWWSLPDVHGGEASTPPALLANSSSWSLTRVRVCSVTQSCPTLGDPMDCSPSGSSVHGISQASLLEWVSLSYSRGSSRSRGPNQPLLHRQIDSLPLRHPGGQVSPACPLKTELLFWAWASSCNDWWNHHSGTWEPAPSHVLPHLQESQQAFSISLEPASCSPSACEHPSAQVQASIVSSWNGGIASSLLLLLPKCPVRSPHCSQSKRTQKSQLEYQATLTFQWPCQSPLPSIKYDHIFPSYFYFFYNIEMKLINPKVIWESKNGMWPVPEL